MKSVVARQVWFTSDTHFGHRRMAALRGFRNVDDMDCALISAWDSVVGPRDTVYHLGDLSFHKNPQTEAILKKLNGTIYLVPGNHDHNPERLLAPGGLTGVLPAGDHKVAPKTKFFLSHYPHRVWSSSHYGRIHLHGHCHGSIVPFGRSLDVGVDCDLIDAGFRPISLEEVLTYMEGRTTPAVDGHGELQE